MSGENYTIKNGVLIEWADADEHIVIPSKVREICDHAFRYYSKDNIKSIHLSENVQRIGSFAFADCENLAEINLPGKVREICEGAFENCRKLSSLTLPAALQHIGERAFHGCTGLRDITIPASVTEIGRHAFEHCLSLKSINVEPGNPEFFSVDGVLYDRDRKTLLVYPAGREQDIFAVPNGVTVIAKDAFRHCQGIAAVVLPDSLKFIGDSAFSYSRLIRMSVPDSVTEMEKDIFANCDRLEMIRLSSSLTAIPEGTFAWCRSLRQISIPEGVTQLGSCAIFCCDSLESVLIPGSVVRLQGHQFLNCPALREIIVAPENPAYASVNGVLYNKDRTKIIHTPARWTQKHFVVPDGIESIGRQFLGKTSDIESVTLPGSVKEICDGAFVNCINLKSISIPEGVQTIGEYAFCRSGIESIELPSSIREIGSNAFMGCSRLTSVKFPETGNCLEIGESAFSYCPKLESISFPSGLMKIGSDAFYYCKSLKNVTFAYQKRMRGNALTIQTNAFYNCDSLREITLPLTKKLSQCGLGLTGNGKMKDFTIHGFRASAAENYAKDYGFSFLEIE